MRLYTAYLLDDSKRTLTAVTTQEANSPLDVLETAKKALEAVGFAIRAPFSLDVRLADVEPFDMPKRTVELMSVGDKMKAALAAKKAQADKEAFEQVEVE